jgi:parallel beta-helix repeat protein
MESGINNQLINNTANYNPEGFTVIDTGNFNNLTSNTANFNTRVGFHLGEFWVGAGAAEYNNLINNTAYGNGYAGFVLNYTSNNNTLLGNNHHHRQHRIREHPLGLLLRFQLNQQHSNQLHHQPIDLVHRQRHCDNLSLFTSS